MTTVSTPTGSNSAVNTGDAVVSSIVQGGVTAGESLLFADFPFLALPGIKQLVDATFNFLAGYVIKGLSNVVAFTIIDIQVGHETSNFNTALANLKTAQASGNAAQIAQALAAFQAAAQALGGSDGSGAPV